MSDSALNHVLAVIDADSDPEDRAFVQGLALAQSYGARLTALSTLRPPEEVARLARHAGLSPGDASERLRREAEAKLEARIATHGTRIEIDHQVRFGRPFLEIIHAVTETEADLVVKRAEPTAGPTAGLTGWLASTDLHLLRKCPCPLWLLTGNRGPGRSVVAAVDLGIGLTPTSEEAHGQTELNRRILDTAARLAERLDRELHVIHVWEATGEHLVRRWSGGEAAVIRYVSETETQHEKALARLVDSTQQRWITDPPHSGQTTATGAAPSIHWHQLRGNPRTVIPEQASALQAEVLVMGTIARTGVPALIIGNTAEDILNRAPCSLVTVKPPGFVSLAT